MRGSTGRSPSRGCPNKLEIDIYAAGVVQDIFNWKIEGMSQGAIAKALTARGILPPSEYKRSQGIKFKSGFQKKARANWTAIAVSRILSNPAYIGTMIQGVRTRPNYKIKTVVTNTPENWSVIENAFEPIVSVKTFRLVQRLLAMDTRVPPNCTTVFPLAGLMVCGDCGSAMVRRTVSGKNKYVYYTCSASKDKGICSSHLIPEQQLLDTVLALLQKHILLVVQLDECLSAIKDAPLQRIGMKKAQERFIKAEDEAEKYRKLKVSLYQDFREDIITKEDYLEIRAQYDARITDAIIAKDQIQRELDQQSNSSGSRQQWMQDFIDHRNIQTLTRAIAVECIEQIAVFEDRKLEVEFTHSQDYASLTDHLEEYYQRESTLSNGEVG